MRIGIDFDNTIACHDRSFHAAAVERGLIAPHVSPDKTSVRDTLRAAGKDADFTLLQGYVYGPGMDQAHPFPGLHDALRALRAAGHALVVVSHRTRVPFAGPSYDLHAAARAFLDRHGLSDPTLIEAVWLETSKSDKLSRIAMLDCAAFIDDLPEILASPEFPSTTLPVLFDPDDHHTARGWTGLRCRSWADVPSTFRREGR